MPDPTDFFGGIAGGLSDLFGGGGSATDQAARRLVKEQKVRELRYAYERYGKDSSQFAYAKKKWPSVWKEVQAGKWRSLWDLDAARPAQFGTRPTRAGDLPLRPTRDAVIPAVGGPMRRIPLGALATRASGPLFYGAIAHQLATSELGKKLLLTPGPFAMHAGMQTSTVGTAIRAVASVGERAARVLDPTRPPPPPDPRLIPRNPIPPVKVTAKRLPERPVGPGGGAVTSPSRGGLIVSGGKITTAPTPGGAVVVPFWQTLLKQLPTIALAYLKRDRPARGSRVTITNSPFADPPATPTPTPEPIPTPLTPLEPGGADCDCGTKPKRRQTERKNREVCYTGRYIERLNGLQKTRLRKTKCLPSRKKRA